MFRAVFDLPDHGRESAIGVRPHGYDSVVVTEDEIFGRSGGMAGGGGVFAHDCSPWQLPCPFFRVSPGERPIGTLPSHCAAASSRPVCRLSDRRR